MHFFIVYIIANHILEKISDSSLFIDHFHTICYTSCKGGTCLMNLKALHHYLTTLSPSEEKYRNGYVYDGWKDMPRKQCNGIEYAILDLDVAYSHLTISQPITLPDLMQNYLRYQSRKFCFQCGSGTYPYPH